MKNRRKFLKESMMAGLSVSAAMTGTFAKALPEKEKDIRLGIIGLDTSHSPAFAKYINDPQKDSMKGVRISAAYPYGSKRIESSAERIPEYTNQFREMGITITESIDALLKQTDGILLETNDGTMHYEQLMEVIRAKKPVFIDKPVAANLADTIRIYEAAGKYKVPIFSASSLRYLKKAQAVRYEQAVGEVVGASTFSPEKWEPSHTDLYWYGIHGVEILYTLMGMGCTRIRRTLTENTDQVTGVWEGERIGSFRGDLHGRQFYGGTAFGTKGVMEVGPFDGYDALVEEIAQFFRTGKSPVEDRETTELYTFMEAADVSKKRNGDWVELKEVYDRAFQIATG